MSDARAAWLAERRRGLGSSDVARILSGHVADVYVAKVACAEVEQTDYMRWGRVVEPIICAWAADELGIVGRKVDHELTWHPSVPWAFASPDWIADDPEQGGIEAKNHGGWLSREYRDGPVPHEVAQVVWQMACLDRPRWHLAVSFGGPPRIWTIERDHELESFLFRRCEVIWKQIEDREEPTL